MSSSTYFVADHYCVSHVPAATILGSRLSDILARMHQGHPLTKYALDFLQKQDLPGLYRLACGEMTHDAYIAGLDRAYLARHQAAKAAHDAQESEQQAREACYRAGRPQDPASKVAPNRDWVADHNLHRKREREASEAILQAQRARQAEWKAQRERNGELAAAACQARAITANLPPPTVHDIAAYFHLEHVAAAVCPPLSDLLEALFHGRPLTGDEIKHLQDNAPEDMYRLAFGQLTLAAYMRRAKATEADVIARKVRKEAVEAARIARENDPEYIAMMQTRALYGKYGVSLTDESLLPQMTKLLQQIDTGHRLPKEEWGWITSTAREHCTKEICEAYHRLEAEFHAEQYRRSKHPRQAVNASGHYRKCQRSAVALELLDGLAEDRLKHPKLRSAVLTTRGGVMRDLERRPEAIQMGKQAHALMPRDYRPCTLLGAVHMEQRDFTTGGEWYRKAQARGAPQDGIDAELRSIYRQLDAAGREAMKRFLLEEDSHRYAWVNEQRHVRGNASTGLP